MQSVPFLLFPMLVISKYNKQNSLCISSPWRQLSHWCVSSLHLTPVPLHGETTACLSVERNGLKSHTWLLFCQYFSMEFLLREVLNSLKAQAGCAAVCAPCWGGEGSLSSRLCTCWGQTFLSLSSSAFHLSIFWWNEAILIERNAMYSQCVWFVCFLKSLSFFHISAVL